MSSGADCSILEAAPGEWYYRLQQYPYGATEEYDHYGPFLTRGLAEMHLRDTHSNPGGYSVLDASRMHPERIEAWRAAARGSLR